mgnify:CR=1 FL=1
MWSTIVSYVVVEIKDDIKKILLINPIFVSPQKKLVFSCIRRGYVIKRFEIWDIIFLYYFLNCSITK